MHSCLAPNDKQRTTTAAICRAQGLCGGVYSICMNNRLVHIPQAGCMASTFCHSQEHVGCKHSQWLPLGTSFIECRCTQHTPCWGACRNPPWNGCGFACWLQPSGQRCAHRSPAHDTVSIAWLGKLGAQTFANMLSLQHMPRPMGPQGVERCVCDRYLHAIVCCLHNAYAQRPHKSCRKQGTSQVNM
jgi:hypothetical protein